MADGEARHTGRYFIAKYEHNSTVWLWDADAVPPQKQSWGWGADGAELIRGIPRTVDNGDWLNDMLVAACDPEKPVLIELTMTARRIEDEDG